MSGPALLLEGSNSYVREDRPESVGLAEFLRVAEDAATSLDLRRLLKAALAAEGYDNFQLLRFHRRQLAGVIWSELTHGASGWRAAEAWTDCLPLLGHVIEGGVPLRWSVADQGAVMRPGQHIFLALARQHGLHEGVAIPVPGVAAMADLLIVSRGQPAHTQDGRCRIWTLAAMAFVICSRLRQIDLAISPKRQPVIELSPRELEVLNWCKDGKSYSEIGTIMTISSKTVEFHMSNIMRKLGVNQKIAAIIAAAKQGLIEL